MFVNMLLLPLDMHEVLGSGSLNKLFSYASWNVKIIDCFYKKRNLKFITKKNM